MTAPVHALGGGRERCLGCGEFADEVWPNTPCSAGNGYEGHNFVPVDENGMGIARAEENDDEPMGLD